MNDDGHDSKSGPRPAIAASKTWPEVPSAIGRSEATASGETPLASGAVGGYSGVAARPPRAAYRAPDRNFEALCARACEHAERGALEDGLRIALVCIEEEPLHHGGYLAAAIIQQLRGRYRDAEVLLVRALLIFPGLPEAAARLSAVRQAMASRVA